MERHEPMLDLTLMEFMILLSIVSVFAAVSLPKFADRIRKAKEVPSRGHVVELPERGLPPFV